MSLELTGIEVSADLAVIGSVFSAYLGWVLSKNKEKNERELKEKERAYSVTTEKLSRLIPLTEDLIIFINEFERNNNISKEHFITIPEKIKKLGNSINQFQLDLLGCTSEIMNFITSCNNDFKYVSINDQTNRGIIFIVYSIINLTFELFKYNHGEGNAKKYIKSIFPVGDDISNLLNKYNKMRLEYKIVD